MLHIGEITAGVTKPGSGFPENHGFGPAKNRDVLPIYPRSNYNHKILNTFTFTFKIFISFLKQYNYTRLESLIVTHIFFCNHDQKNN